MTEPVGAGFPVPPLTATATESVCAVVTLDTESVTVTVGVLGEVGFAAVLDDVPASASRQQATENNG